MTVLNILKRVPIFRDISDADLRRIETILREKDYDKDEHVFMETDTPEEFYIVSEGRIKIYSMSYEGQIKALDYLEKGSFFGEMALLDKQPRSANAVAMQDSKLFSISYADFQKFLVSHPDILLTITRTICQRLRKADLEIEMFSFRDVKARLIMCLLNLGDKYGEKTEQGVIIPVEFTHKDLSELIGTAREVVSRLLKELKQEKLVKTENQKFLILSPENLKKKIIE
jgi:CRP-like cAMP-binding protein